MIESERRRTIPIFSLAQLLMVGKGSYAKVISREPAWGISVWAGKVSATQTVRCKGVRQKYAEERLGKKQTKNQLVLEEAFYLLLFGTDVRAV